MNLALPRPSRGGLRLLFSCLFFSAGCAKGFVAEDLDAGIEEPPPVPSSIETVVTTTVLPAGTQLSAECRVYDENGERMLDIEGAQPRVISEPLYLFEGSGAELTAAKVGSGRVTCTFAQYGLFDEGVEIEIVPGPPHSVITRLDDDRVAAGEAASSVCYVYDAYGNEITDADATLAVSPAADGVAVDGLTATVTRAGTFEVSCAVSGALATESDFLHVGPGLPHTMTVGLRPGRAFYKVSDVTLLEADVRDRFGNRATGAELSYAEVGGASLAAQSGARFSFIGNGETTLRATVVSPLDPEVSELSAEVPVVVNSAGPAIECLNFTTQEPDDAYTVVRAPGSLTARLVRVSDDFDVSSVQISGSPATHMGDGIYRGTHDVQWGMNFVDVVATDEYGLQNSRTCFFLASQNWTAEDALMSGTVGFKLSQAAFGPGTPGELTSLNEIVRTMLDSDGLKSMVDEGIPGTLNDGDCGVFACNPDVDYNRGSIDWNPVSTSLQLIDGGLRLNVVLPQVRLQVRACGTTCCIGGSTITARVSTIEVGVDVSLELVNGVLRAGISGTPEVSVSTPSLDGSGFCGFLLGLIESLFTGTVRDAIRDALQGFLTTEVGPLLDDLVSSLDVSSLGASFPVPRLDGSGEITLSFGVGLSSLDIVANDRALIGLNTRFTASPIAHNHASHGVAIREGGVFLDPPISSPRTLGLSVNEGVLNQVLHALWRGGFVQGDLDMGSAAQVTLDAHLPPVVNIEGSSAKLALGGVRANIELDVGPSTLVVDAMFGGVAYASVTLDGESLSFGDITLDVENDLYISILSDPIPEDAREALTLVLGGVLEKVLLDAVNEGLPAIPIPTFELPDEVADFGLPANAELGLTDPVLETSGRHFRLQGGFGVR